MRIRSIVVGTAALALLAACGTGGGTTGTPTNATQPTSTSNSGGGTPKIDNPLDVKSFTAEPCKTVTAAQVEAFGLPGVSGRVTSNATGESCIWLGASTPAKMAPGVAFLAESANLSTILPNKDITYKVFEPQPPIQGYPAYLALVADQRNDGGCDVLVGVSDERAMLISFTSFAGSPKYADPCTAVTEFADLAITTIKAGAK